MIDATGGQHTSNVSQLLTLDSLEQLIVFLLGDQFTMILALKALQEENLLYCRKIVKLSISELSYCVMRASE